MNKSVFNLIKVFGLVVTLCGCVNEVPMGEMGSSVALMKLEQTYNPNATQENAGYIPTGSGERMQSTLKIYHQQTASSVDTGAEALPATSDSSGN